MFRKGIYAIIVFILCFSIQAYAAKLVWNANTEPDLAGYKVYRGESSGFYDHIFDVRNVTEHQIEVLAPGTYYYVVTAYNTSGAESEYSNEVIYVQVLEQIAAATNINLVFEGEMNMKKILLILLFGLLLPTDVFSKTAIIGFIALNGGGTGALDAVECEDILGDNTNRAIATGDIAIGVNSAGEFYIYRYNASGTASESSPSIIVPDDRAADCSGNGQWELSMIGDKQIDNTGTFASPITSNPYTFSALHAYNGVLWYGTTGEIDLPAAVKGMYYCIYNTGAFTITIDPNGTDVIVRDGNIQTAGVSITLSSGAGNYVCFVSDANNHLVTTGFKGSLGQGS